MFPRILKADDEHSYLRLSDTVGKDWHDMRSVCGLCQKTYSMSCRTNSPIGLLWAWLVTYPCIGDGDAHKGYWPDFATRQEQREEFYLIEGTDPWFQAEQNNTGPYLDEP